jgi:hypothetical protein
MTVLHALWLPIVLSSVFGFVASSILHMALPWHKGDLARVPDEDGVLNALRPFALPPGDYMIPGYPTSAGMKSPDFAEKINKGPVLVATVMPNGPMKMGRSLALWFLYLLAVNFLTAYVTCHALPVGTAYPRVFTVAGVTAFLGFGAALWQMSIWFRRSWGTTLRSTVDALIYAGLTAGTLGWLWPR